MRTIAVGISYVMAVQLMAPCSRAQVMPKELHVVIVSGDGAVNRVRQIVNQAQEPVVRVEDENQKPIVGAVVVFTLPTEGATGEFANKSKTLVVATDARGDAAAKGLKTNGVPGKLPIQINASYRGLSARAMMTQLTELMPGEKEQSGGHGKTIAILTVIAAAAAGGAVFALRKNGTTAATNPSAPAQVPIGLTAGTGTITAPPH